MDESDTVFLEKKKENRFFFYLSPSDGDMHVVHVQWYLVEIDFCVGG